MDTLLDDIRPFPIQSDLRCQGGPNKPSTIPWWLAEEAYTAYLHLYGTGGAQSLEQLAKRGGFGRKELLVLLRHSPDTERKVIRQFVKRVNNRAEANMEKTGKLEGAHYAAIQLESLESEEP